jgi:hypothetical protein
MIVLTPNLTSPASAVPNPNMSENNSWVPVGNNNGRPFFAQAVYDVTTESLLGQSGFVFLTGGQTAIGEFSTIRVLSACRISSLSADNSVIGGLYNFTLPVDFTLNANINGITLEFGAVFLYRL